MNRRTGILRHWMRTACASTAWASLLLLIALPALAIDEADLLPVDEAFVLDARATAPNRITLSWKIADGYYLYKHRMKVAPGLDGMTLGALQLPKGKAHTDEFFGRVETYRDGVDGTATISTKGPEAPLKVSYQGCADLGICYPPQTRTITVALPSAKSLDASATDAPGAAQGDGLSALGRALAGQAPASGNRAALGTNALPLPPERAFGFEAIVGDGNTLLLRFTPEKGYYLYRDRSSFRIEGAEGITPGKPRWPRGAPHRDDYFGATTVYFDQIDVPLPLVRETASAAARARLIATFQGCQTDGICYPPMTREVALSIPAGVVAAPVAVDASIITSAPAPSPTLSLPASETSASGAPPVQPEAAGSQTPSSSVAAENEGGNEDAIPAAPSSQGAGLQAEDQLLAGALSGPKRWLVLLGFFGAGLLLAFTPCVLPMIPILSGLIAGRGERIGARRAFWLSLVYVLASALVFTAAGVVAGLLGANLQILFQKPWIIALFAALFVALALSMFGLYELQLPASWRARLGAISDRQRGGSWAGVAGMGALSALIVGPCVAPPLAAAVLYIGQTRDPLFGGAALFLLALGMGAPLLAFGVAAGRGLPTSGQWMVAIQRVFGFVFVGMAIWMLSRVLPGALTLALYGVLLLAFACWLAYRATAQASTGLAEGRRWALRCAALLFGLLGATQLVGAMAGGNDPLRPLAGLTSSAVPGGGHDAGALPFRKIKSLADLEREVAAAKAEGKPLLFDFYADWCVACKEMEKYTFPQQQVHAALQDFVLLKADVTANDATDQALMKSLGIIGPPATLYYVNGVERRDLRLFGFEHADAFAQRAARVR